jgi:hypothetical protein
MKRGDIVVCVDNAGMEHKLTNGQTYSVLQISGDFVSVIGDNPIRSTLRNEVYTFYRRRFKLKDKKDV